MVLNKIDTGMMAIRKDGTFISSWKGSLEEVSYKWLITGNTYDYKDALKDYGGKYNGLTRTWHFDCEELPEGLLDLVEVMSNATEGEPGTSDEPPKTIEKIVEKAIIQYKNVTRKRKPMPKAKQRKPMPKAKQRKPRTPQVKNQPGIIPPSYWDNLLLYLSPEKTRPAIAIVGPAGNGKTSAAEAAFKALGIDYIVIDANETLEPGDLVGAMSFEQRDGEAKEVWRDGPITKALREGKGILINEFDALNPRTALCLQSLCQDPGREKKGRYITLPGNTEEDRVYPKSDCALVVTMNTYGNGATREYVGRNSLDAATRDRFTLISTTYENEEQIIQKHGYPSKIAQELTSWAQTMRKHIEDNGIKEVLSLRTLLRMAQALHDYGWDFTRTLDTEFMNRLHPDDRAMLANIKPISRRMF